MLAYVQALLNISLRRSGPEDLPDSRFLFRLTIAAFVLSQLPIAIVSYGMGAVTIKTTVATVLLLIAGLWFLLRLTGFANRYRQTATALMGTSALLSLLSLPFYIILSNSMAPGVSRDIPSLAIFAIVIWSVVINGHIFSRALSRPFAIGVMIALAYLFLNYAVLIELVPLEMRS